MGLRPVPDGDTVCPVIDNRPSAVGGHVGPWTDRSLVMTLPGSVADVLSGHVLFEVESINRLYLNRYVPTLQVGGQVFRFLHDHRGMPVALPAALVLAAAPHGFTVADLAAKVRLMSGQGGYTSRDRDYETLRIGMQVLFHDLGITTPAAAAA
jgi:hypothetical protein